MSSTIELYIGEDRNPNNDTYNIVGNAYADDMWLDGEEILHLYALVELAKNHVLARRDSLRIRETT